MLQAGLAGEHYALHPGALSQEPNSEGSGTPFVENLHGTAWELPDTAGTRYSSLAAVDGGWIAVGSHLEENRDPESSEVRESLRKLRLLAGDGEGVRSLKAPKLQEGLRRQGAVLIVDGGRLAGLAWLEGDTRRQLAVMASEWTGSRWRTPRVVSPPGPGSQLALSATVLADGSWLLAWSAFDGEDDEILWSRYIGGRWTDPARLSPEDNAVPDVTPALAPSGTGAVAAWSRYENEHYRLKLARFDGTRWLDERTAGGKGTLYPVFLPQASAENRLLFRDAGKRGWTALELGEDGRETARVHVPAQTLRRPMVTSTGSGTAAFSWSGDAEPLTAHWRPAATDGETARERTREAAP